jgi:MFS family permease
MTNESSVAHPLRVFGVTWIGQLVSIVGSGLTSFAIGVRVFQETGSVTQLALVSFAYAVPMTLLSPVAGALVDRWDRRTSMLLSDLGAGIGVLCLWLLLVAGRRGVWSLAPWHFLLPIMLISACDALRWPAYRATTSLLIPKQQHTRANGLIELANGAGQVGAPVLAAALVTRIGLERVILIDLSTFVVAVASLLLVRFPRPPASAAGQAGKGSLRSEIASGWAFIRARPGLVRLLATMFSMNLAGGFITVLITPLVLDVSDVSGLGVALSSAGVGMLLGAIVISVWGGPRRRVYGLAGAVFLSGLVLFMGALPPSVPLIAAGAAIFMFNMPVMGSCSQAIWLSKVPPDLQGRVFAVRRMIASVASPLTYLLAGPIADRMFEPWLAPGGALAGSIGRVIGIGPGRGIGLLFIVLGVVLCAVGLAVFASPRLRELEDELPDALGEAAVPGGSP